MMSLQDMTEVLIRADRLGLTTYKDGQAAAWLEAVMRSGQTLDKRLATEAVQELATSIETVPPRGIRPYDLLRCASRITEARQGRVPLELPAGMTPAQEQEWRKAWTFAVGRGADREAARAYAEKQTGHEHVPAIQSHASAEVREKLNQFKARFGQDTKKEKNHG